MGSDPVASTGKPPATATIHYKKLVLRVVSLEMIAHAKDKVVCVIVCFDIQPSAC